MQLSIVKHLNPNDGVAILNCLTHFLKLGDVTVKRPDGSFEIVEAKEGHKTSGRITRQKKRMAETVEFLNFGAIETLSGKLSITELPVVPENFMTNIGNLIGAAEKHGAAIERIGQHLIVTCADYPRMVEIGPDEPMRLLDTANEWVADWERAGDFVLPPYWGFDKYKFIRNHAPFSIFPISVHRRVKLMTNALLIRADVNLSAVGRYFENKGWRITKSPKQHLGAVKNREAEEVIGFITVEKEGLEYPIPPGLIGRLGFEFLRPRTLVEIFEAILQHAPRDTRWQFFNLAGEHSLWD